MILINVKFQIKPEHADGWPAIAAAFTAATRAEPGNLWFDWSRSVEDPNEYVLIEAFEDDGAAVHVASDHFARMRREFPRYLLATPQIVSVQVERDGWGPMSEITVE